MKRTLKRRSKRKDPSLDHRISNEHAIALLEREQPRTSNMRRINRGLITSLKEEKIIAFMRSDGKVVYASAKNDPELKARQTYFSNGL